MIKHFCDLCEGLVTSSRINNDSVIVNLGKFTICIAIRESDGQNTDKLTICEACLFAQADKAQKKLNTSQSALLLKENNE